jgi:hypothetical protein
MIHMIKHKNIWQTRRKGEGDDRGRRSTAVVEGPRGRRRRRRGAGRLCGALRRGGP